MSNFRKDLDNFVNRVGSIKEHLNSEEATKMALVVPFINLLGYDVFNPLEVVPEYIADVGIKKGEKVDYAIVQDGKPIMLIEAKCVGEDLSKHYSQLYRYFSTTSSKFAILTDGVVYKFYSDIEEVNRLDSEPFIVIDLLNISDNDKKVLEAFRKSNFNINELSNDIVKWKYELKIKNSLELLFNSPSDDFIKMLSGSVDVAKFRPIVEGLLNNYKYIDTNVGTVGGETKDDIVATVGVGLLPLNEFDYAELSKSYSRLKPLALCVNGEELYLKTWKGVVVVAIDYLYKTHKDKLCTLIDEVFKGNKVFLYSNLDALKAKYTISNDTFVHKIDEGVYMYVNYSPIRSVETILVILGLLGLPKDYFSLKYSMTTI